MNPGNATSEKRAFPWAMNRPEEISAETVASVIAQFEQGELSLRQAAAALADILLVLPKLGMHVPISMLERCKNEDSQPEIWTSLALLMLHTSRADQTREWLRSVFTQGCSDDSAWRLFQHFCDWFPECADSTLLRQMARRGRMWPILIQYQEAAMYRERTERAEPDAHSILSSLFSNSPRILVVHNTVDGHGDEMLRMYALLQSLLDAFPDLEITLFTDRSYLYDHPRVHAISISSTEVFENALAEAWDGIVNFYEPYHESNNNYNSQLQKLLLEHLKHNTPSLYLWGRKGANHFVFESLLIGGEESAAKFGIRRRLLPLNYEGAMRLIACLGLPLRTGENVPRAGAIQTRTPHEAFHAGWQELTSRFRSRRRPVAILNAFGGTHPMKGFTSDSFDRLARIIDCLIEEGFALVLVPNGDGWGGAAELDAVMEKLQGQTRHFVALAPILSNRQENMRQLKYFVSYCDLVITIEGWMMHLAYALGKPYRLLMAPYSFPSEWHPHGRSANQRHWLPPIDRSIRWDLVVAEQEGGACAPPPIHYPEKALLEAAIKLWAAAGSARLSDIFRYWITTEDKHIRRWAVAALGTFDAAYFREELLKSLEDENHTVRGVAAGALISSDIDFTEPLGPDWLAILQAYELIGQWRFPEATSIGAPAAKAWQACLSGDDLQVRRDAQLLFSSGVLDSKDE